MKIKEDCALVALWLVATVLATLAALRTPSFANPDEGAHYLRNFEISRGHLLNGPGNVGVQMDCAEYLIVASRYAPVAYFEPAEERLREGRNPCTVSTKNSAGTYAAPQYAFSAFGTRIAERVGATVVGRLRVGRAINAIVSSLICLLALLSVRHYRAPLTMLMLMPMALWQRAALSADSLTFAICVAFAAHLVGIAERNVMTRRDLAVACALAACVASTKIVYGLLCFSMLALYPLPGLAESRFRRVMALGLPGALAIAVSLIPVKLSDPSLIYISPQASPQTQVAFITHAPFSFLGVLYQTVVSQGLDLSTNGISSFTWLPADLEIRQASVIVVLFFLVLATTRPIFVGRQRLIIGAVCMVTLVTIALPLYITYTSPRYPEVYGLQGRYFIPVLCFLTLALAFSKPKYLHLGPGPRLFVSMVLPLCLVAQLLWKYIYFPV